MNSETAASGHPYRSSATRARVAVVLLGVVAAAAALRLVVAVAGLVVLQQSTEGVVSTATFDQVVMVWTAAGSIYALGVIACAIAFLAWLSRAVDNIPALGGGQPSASPRWAIAWWFIPIGNLGMPYEVVRDLSRRMHPDGTARHRPLIVIWWFAFVLGNAVDGAASRLPADSLMSATRYLIVEAVACSLLVAAAVLAVLMVRQIERMAQARAVLFASMAAGEATIGSQRSDEAAMSEGTDSAAARNWRMRPSWVSFVSLTGAVVVSFATVAIASAGLFGADTAPREDTALESTLPHQVMGRSLTVWSVRGRHLFIDVMGLDKAALDGVTRNLAAKDVAIDDVTEALAGRSSPEDPAYMIVAFRFRGLVAQQDLGTFGIDHPDAGTWTSVALGGKEVEKGELAMYDQTSHLRGLPYVYDTQDTRYIVITDDEGWAADALRQLP